MLKVRRILTEILLEATENQVHLIAKEEFRRAKSSGILAFSSTKSREKNFESRLSICGNGEVDGADVRFSPIRNFEKNFYIFFDEFELFFLFSNYEIRRLKSFLYNFIIEFQRLLCSRHYNKKTNFFFSLLKYNVVNLKKFVFFKSFSSADTKE